MESIVYFGCQTHITYTVIRNNIVLLSYRHIDCYIRNNDYSLYSIHSNKSITDISRTVPRSIGPVL